MFNRSLITNKATMVHEVHNWDSDSDYVEDEERDELDQESPMAIQDRVNPAELREMAVGNICRVFLQYHWCIVRRVSDVE